MFAVTLLLTESWALGTPGVPARADVSSQTISPDGCVPIGPIWRLFGRRTRPNVPKVVRIPGGFV
jgi:hypothetical protein